jgi:D-glycero-alpha-D-manno-heptose 1-phosphate guanylyltransferase
MTQHLDVTAVILAGGLGTRLRSVVADRPKALATVNQRPFLSFLLEKLAAAGIGHAVICTGYLGDQIRDAFGTCYRGMQLAYSQESEPRGTGGALRLALPLFPSELLLVLNGDSFCNFDYRAFLGFHRQKLATMSLCLAEVADVSRYGAVGLDDGGRILQFCEKGVARGAGVINAGVYLTTRTLISTIPPEVVISLERDVIPTQIGAGLHGFRSPGKFIDIGVPADYAAAQQFFVPAEMPN